jgi:hypothetical protein
MATLVGIGLARGTLIHLAEEGAAETLCGRRHGVNPRYIKVGFTHTLPASEVTCRTCVKAGA